MSRISTVLLMLVGGLFSALAAAKSVDLDQASLDEISKRIAPVATVCKDGENCADNVGAVVSTASGPRSGEELFNQFCAACHSTGLLGAPKKGDLAAWKAKEASAGGFDKMLGLAISGVGSMPPKGTCMDCTDEEIGNAIEFMSGLKP